MSVDFDRNVTVAKLVAAHFRTITKATKCVQNMKLHFVCFIAQSCEVYAKVLIRLKFTFL